MNRKITPVLVVFLFANLFLGGSRLLWAQEAALPESEFRTWQDPNSGRLYWNKHQPVYLYLSSKPSGEDLHLLKSESMPRYATPFYFDTEGRNFMRTRWAVDPETRKAIVPQQEVLWEVYADGLPPQTRIKFLDNKGIMAPKRCLGKDATFFLQATDAVSGLDAIYYSVNGEAFQKYVEPIRLTKEGSNEIRYCAEDHVGNREEIRRYQIDVDISSPITVSEIMGIVLGKENTFTPNTQIRLEAKDEFSTVRSIRYRLDSGRWQEYSPVAKISMKQVADGYHTLAFYSVDNLGNTEEVQKLDFYLDAIPPITISDILGDKFLVGEKLYFSSRTKMKITAVDNHSGVREIRYSVDGGEFQLYNEPFYMPNVQGWHTVKYYSVDSTDNSTTSETNLKLHEYRMKVDKVFVDLTGPTINYRVTGLSYARNDTTFVGAQSQVLLSGNDSESGLHHLAYAIDRDPWEKQYDAPFTLEGLASGTHEIEYFGYDNVGNRNVKTFMVIVDCDAPRALYRTSVEPYKNEKDENGNPVYPLDALIYLSAQDNMTGVAKLQYSLNGKPLVEYKQPFKGLERGRNRLKIVTTDYVGNTKEIMEQFEVR